MTITPVSFTKATYGGTVDISRQDIDWTSPGAWDILIRDLANVYAIQTETAVAAAFKAGGHARRGGRGHQHPGRLDEGAVPGRRRLLRQRR